MNRFFQIITVAALATFSACAGVLSFDTNSSYLTFGLQTGKSITYVNGDILTYSPISTTLGSVPSGYPFGSLILSCQGGGTTCGPDLLTGTNLALIFNQTAPIAGIGTINSSSFSGSITGTTTSQDAKVTWLNPSVNIGPVNYTITNSPLNLVNAAAGGTTTIQGFVATPEPGSILLMSSGLAGLFFARRRRA